MSKQNSLFQWDVCACVRVCLRACVRVLCRVLPAGLVLRGQWGHQEKDFRDQRYAPFLLPNRRETSFTFCGHTGHLLHAFVLG